MHIAHPVYVPPSQQMGGLFDVLGTVAKTAGNVISQAIPVYLQVEQAKTASKVAQAQIAAQQAGVVTQPQQLPGGYAVPMGVAPSATPSWLIPAALAGGGVLVFMLLTKK